MKTPLPPHDHGNPLVTYFPFGPPIGYAELPKELVNDLNKGCDDITKDEELLKSEDFSHSLVGQVKQELKIPIDVINKWGKWFGTQVQRYVAGYYNELYIPEQNFMIIPKEQALQNINKLQVDVISAWYVQSFDGDYNPIHTHPDSELTCVGFLKVPDLSKERKKRHANLNCNHVATAGALEILSHGGVITPQLYTNDGIGFVPKVGNWYLFPANLRHTAYPFKGIGERRSFSMNLNTKMFFQDSPDVDHLPEERGLLR